MKSQIMVNILIQTYSNIRLLILVFEYSNGYSAIYEYSNEYSTIRVSVLVFEYSSIRTNFLA